MTRRLHWGVLLALTLLLAGCKVELYRGLPEDEANQMLALLMTRSISAVKSSDKDGAAQLEVEEAQFAEAVEILRQNGFPRQRVQSITDVFPAGQLVSSPTQERAKLEYIKEQEIERMLATLDGVITARVTLADQVEARDGSLSAPAVSVFVKYSPSENMTNSETDIRRLVMTSVPDLTPQRISVVLQPASYRFVEHVRPANAIPWWIEWLRANALLVGVVATGLGALVAAVGALLYLRRQAARP